MYTDSDQPQAPAGNPESHFTTPHQMSSSPSARRTPPSFETIGVNTGSSAVNEVHRPSPPTAPGDERSQNEPPAPWLNSLAPAGPSFELEDENVTSQRSARQKDIFPASSLRNPPPLLDGDSMHHDGTPSTHQARIGLMEIELRMKELELEQQRLSLERTRLSLQTRGGSARLIGEEIEDARRVCGEKVDEWTAETERVGRFSGGLVGLTPATASTLPPYSRQPGPLHSTSRYGVNPSYGNASRNRCENTGDHTIPTLTQSQLYARQGNLRELPTFSGRPEEWTMFVSNLERSTAMHGYTDEENIERLAKALRGKAREVVGLRLTANNFPQIMNVLRRHFGRPEIIVNCLIKKIRQLPMPKLERIDSVVDFGNAVQEMAAVISASGMYGYAYNVTLLQEIVDKLPPVLRREWSHYCLRLGIPTIQDFSNWIERELEAATYNTMPTFDEPRMEGSTSEERKRKTKPNTYLHTMVREKTTNDHAKRNRCVVCKGLCVSLADCPRFAEMDVKQRWDTIKQERMCRKCLRSHVTICNEQRLCGKDGCVLQHHNMLHRDRPGYSTPATTTAATVNAHTAANDGVLFQYIPVTIHGNGKNVETVAFFDSGSSGTFIEKELIDELGLDGKPHPLCIRWTGDTKRDERDSVQLELKIAGTGNKNKLFTLPKVHTIRRLSLPPQSLSARQMTGTHQHLRNLPLKSYTNASPRLLIGIDNCHLVRPLRYAEGKEQEPAAVKTQLGWVVFGPCAKFSSPPQIHRNYHMCMCSAGDKGVMDTAMREFFSIESLGVAKTTPLLSKDDERALQMLTAETKLMNGRYETRLLWRYDDVRLPCSREMALKRYDCLRRKMRQNPDIANSVLEKMKSYEEQGYIRRLTSKELTIRGERDWYLPVFPVFNPNKPGKVRLVFDAAAKARGVSLNTFLLAGPDLLAGLLTVLYKFREHRVAIVGDIKEMFFQVRMKPEDQRSQLLFWDPEEVADRDPTVYAVAVMTFGAACSPSSAQFVKNLNASRFEQRLPRATRCIREEHYVDDMLASVETEEEAISLAEEVRYIHREGGFEIRNWLSNSSRVAAKMNQKEQTVTGTIMCTGTTTEKVLGMWWDTSTDEFTYRLSPKHDAQLLSGKRMPNKREVLSTLMTVYDPMGLIGNLLMYVKILLQEIWRAGLDWDEELHGKLAEKWKKWVKVLPDVFQVRVPRCYRQLTSHHAKDVQLHIFCDASESAMAAIAYLRFEENEHIECSLIGSKTRVAPLRFVSIPRLELQAAVIGARFASSIVAAHRLKITQVTFWTDSRDVICWLRADHRRYSQFVAFRVSEILETTESDQWRWLPTKLNVADEGTKWQRIPDFNLTSRWFRGPDFLWQPKVDWPTHVATPVETSEEIRKILLHHSSGTKPWISVDRFSSWLRLGRKFARGLLTQSELERAEREIFKLAQRDAFPEDIQRLQKSDDMQHPWKPKVTKRSPIYKLCPELDEHGVLRARGRLANCLWADEAMKRSVILPRGHRVTRLLLERYHQRFKHVHHQTAVNELRSRFCIPRLMAEYNTIRRMCQHCKNRDAHPNPPRMADVPLERLGVNARPFTYTGVDYFGPLTVAVGRRSEKRWGVLLTCLTTRAVHLEIAHTLTTSSCIMAIRRFIARRGKPTEILSDRGTNFVGAARELKEALNDVDDNRLIEEFTDSDLTWKFNPPGSPHFGGCWERLIQSVKKVLGEMRISRLPTDEVLLSTFAEIEMILNSRPLTQVPLDEESESPLTPNHFLLGSANKERSMGNFDDNPATLKVAWKASQVLAKLFWKKWIAEYLPTLTRRGKWFDKSKPIAVGDIVVIVDGNLPKNTWPKGRVVAVHQAKDGQIRQASVQTSHGLFQRPATKIAVLDVN